MSLESTGFTNTSFAPTSSCTDGIPDDSPPPRFHSVHSKNIRISSDGSTARCVDGEGVAFSAGPVEVNEKVSLRLLEGSCSPFLTLRIGFIFCNPISLVHTIDNYTNYEIDRDPLIISRTIDNHNFKFNNIVYYYMNSDGNLHYGVYGRYNWFFKYGDKAQTLLWAFFHIKGKRTIVQFVDPRDLNEARSRYAESQDRQICSLSSLSIEEPLRAPRYKNPLVPLSLHRMTGSNIQFVDERGVAARIEADFCQGYVFTAHPVRPGQTIVVQILVTETKYVGRSAIGLTSCDPASLRPLSFYTDRLLDRSEYWVVHEVVADELQAGDEIVATLTSDDEMRVSINESNLETVMHVDHTVRLWAFVNMFGKIQKVRIFSSPEIQAPTPPQQLRVPTSSAAPITAGDTGMVHDVSLQPHNGSQNVTNHQQGLTLTSGQYIEPVQSTSQQILAGLQQSSTQPPTCSLVPQTHCPRSEGQRSTTSQNDSSEQLQIPNEHSESLRHERIPNGPSTSQEQENNFTDKECIICYENPIDSVLYMCGHMCMCYRCAVQLWRGMDDGQCPLCRTEIRDVIRTYKS